MPKAGKNALPHLLLIGHGACCVWKWGGAHERSVKCDGDRSCWCSCATKPVSMSMWGHGPQSGPTTTTIHYDYVTIIFFTNNGWAFFGQARCLDFKQPAFPKSKRPTCYNNMKLKERDSIMSSSLVSERGCQRSKQKGEIWCNFSGKVINPL